MLGAKQQGLTSPPAPSFVFSDVQQMLWYPDRLMLKTPQVLVQSSAPGEEITDED